MRIAWLALGAALAGCAPAQPLVDMNDVDPVAYQRVLDHCEAVATPDETAGPAIAGAVMGASFGLGLGGLISGVPAGTAAAIGTGSGAVVGAGAATLANDTPTGEKLSPGPPQTVEQCLVAHGYKIVGHI